MEGNIEGPSLGTDIPAGAVKEPILPLFPTLGAEKEILLPVAARGTSGPARSHPRERRPQEPRMSFEQRAWCVPGLHLLSVGSEELGGRRLSLFDCPCHRKVYGWLIYSL